MSLYSRSVSLKPLVVSYVNDNIKSFHEIKSLRKKIDSLKIKLQKTNYLEQKITQSKAIATHDGQNYYQESSGYYDLGSDELIQLKKSVQNDHIQQRKVLKKITAKYTYANSHFYTVLHQHIKASTQQNQLSHLDKRAIKMVINDIIAY